MLLPTNTPCCFQEILTLAVQLPYEVIHASTLISKQAHPLQRWIQRQPIQNTRATHREYTLATMQQAEIKKPTAQTYTDTQSAECTKHGIQITKYTYPPYQSKLGEITYPEQCYGIKEALKQYRAHHHPTPKQWHTNNEVYISSLSLWNWQDKIPRTYNGTTKPVKRYRAHYHLLCKDIWNAHVDCNFPTTSIQIDLTQCMSKHTRSSQVFRLHP